MTDERELNANAALAEKEENERAYERILGPRSYQEVADTLAQLESMLVNANALADAEMHRAQLAESDADELREELVEAWESAVDWAAYAGEYFQDKHDLKSDLAKLERARACLRQAAAEKTQCPRCYAMVTKSCGPNCAWEWEKTNG